MATPRVSICLPNLNTLPYLAERLATIQEQTFTDWELLVYDGYSEDGAWEFFQEFAKSEPRMRCWQGPREGTPGSWSPCIREARGEFIYVATSDDTMAPDCLEKMVAALDGNPDCDLAHCAIRIIDENGNPAFDWWATSSLFAKSSGDLTHLPHKRMAPFDGILCLLGDNVYTSVTQLLIRRSLFDKIGYFPKEWGAPGDYHWNIRAGLVASTVHVPDTWGGWRIHPNQATVAGSLQTPAHQAKLDSMIEDVVSNLGKYASDKGQLDVLEGLVKKAEDLRNHLRGHAQQETPTSRRLYLLQQALAGQSPAWQHLTSMASSDGKWPLAAPESVKAWFDYEVLVPLPVAAKKRVS